MKNEQDVWDKETNTDNFERIRNANKKATFVGSIALEGGGIGALAKAAKVTKAATFFLNTSNNYYDFRTKCSRVEIPITIFGQKKI